MTILAIDPGPTESAWLYYNSATGSIPGHGFGLNAGVLGVVRSNQWPEHVVIEMVQAYGMPVGKEVFDTVFWAGRFAEATGVGRFSLLHRPKIKAHLCNDAGAKDTNVKRVLMDRFGGDAAIGTKKNQGPLYGLRAHEFAALAVAVTFAETHKEA